MTFKPYYIQNQEKAEEKEQTSVFHQGFNQVLRLHELWLKSNRYSLAGDFYNWRLVLEIIWRELSPEALKRDKHKTKPEETYQFKTQELDKQIILAQNKKNRDMWYKYLVEKEIFLRSLEFDLGKGAKTHDKDEDSDFDV